MNRFYFPQIAEGEQQLPESESKHAIRVLRLKEGDEIEVLDGQGKGYEVIITDAHPKRCVFEIKTSTTHPLPIPSITIGLSPTKSNDRFEWFLEKCTEIGISSIIPLKCKHSERKKINRNRAEKVLVAAMKQSGRYWKPDLHSMEDINNLILKSNCANRFIAHCRSTELPLLKSVYPYGKNVVILIGPEGDFATDEIEAAENNGFTSISLGKSRLRTETAGIVACHTINLCNA